MGIREQSATGCRKYRVAVNLSRRCQRITFHDSTPITAHAGVRVPDAVLHGRRGSGRSGRRSGCRCGFKAPYIPAGDSDVLQEVPSVTDPAVASMQGLRAQFTANRKACRRPSSSRTRTSIIAGKSRCALRGYAEAIIAPWMAKPLPPPGALLTQATILQYRHHSTMHEYC